MGHAHRTGEQSTSTETNKAGMTELHATHAGRPLILPLGRAVRMRGFSDRFEVWGEQYEPTPG